MNTRSIASEADAIESSDLDAVVARRCDDQNHLVNHVPVADATGAFTAPS